MASLSLPKVLHARKSSTDVERESFEKYQAVSLSKAVSPIEGAVKEKHVRRLIIGTFQLKGASLFWSHVVRLPLQENPIVCWKFCHVLHKLLREGHHNSMLHSYPHHQRILELGKLWGHLREGYGKLIFHYCQLIQTKLNFHKRNPRFPGNLLVTTEELEKIAENDINNYFQMSVEMFDYMDDILSLQQAVVSSLDMSRSSSMTNSGQCRLAPLIPCIQDSSQLYDFCVKILFRLHSSLPSDTLSGHRERFLKQFRLLKDFYIFANHRQYFKSLIQVPLLPDNPPNFLIQSEFNTYVAPVVILPAEEPPDEGMLVDMSDTSSTGGDTVDMGFHQNGSISPDVLMEKEQIIEQLQQEIERLRMEIQRLMSQHEMEMQLMKQHINDLEMRLAEKESLLNEEKQVKEELLVQASAAPKLEDVEKRARIAEEKFQRLKDVYQKLREEHIHLIRQKADVDKQLVTAKHTTEETERTRVQTEDKLRQLIEEKSSAEESLHRSTVQKEEEILQLIAAKQSEEAKTRELEKRIETIAAQKHTLEEKVLKLSEEKLRTEENLQMSAVQKEEQIQSLVAAKQTEEEQKKELENLVDTLSTQKFDLERQLASLSTYLEDVRVQLKDAEESTKMKELQMKDDAINKLYYLLVGSVSEAEAIIQRAVEEIDNPALSALTCSPDYFLGLSDPLHKSLDGMCHSFHDFKNDPESIGGVVRSLALFSHLVADYLISGKSTSNTSPDIERGEHFAEACKTVGKESLLLLACLKSREKCGEVDVKAGDVKQRLKDVAELLERITNALKGDQSENVGDMVESELATMDKEIEEAVKKMEEMLNKSREADTGIKLEVNGKILDSCSALMRAIQQLVRRSKALQIEIVSQGKGTASAKEFYKRNHRWTEGLLSAAKTVGLGAKFLVDAADRVVNGNAKFEQLVVASQEIAASTAQLVVASRVKAERSSENLKQVSGASKGVTQATATVVATAKACSQMVDDSDIMDVTKLSLHQAKRLEMDSQVRVLELESALTKERCQLSSLRRHHYQLAGESEGWSNEDVQDVSH